MRINKVIIAVFFIAFVVFPNWNVGFAQVEKGESFFYSGIIQAIPGDFKSIIVNKKSFFLTGDAKIVDQKGNRLGIHELKPGVDVAIDAIREPAGFVIKKVVIIKDPGV
jgi:hypothetical protein